MGCFQYYYLLLKFLGMVLRQENQHPIARLWEPDDTRRLRGRLGIIQLLRFQAVIVL